MKVSTKILQGTLALLATSQGEKKTVTLRPGQNALTLTTASPVGSVRASLLAAAEEDDIQNCALPAHILASLAGAATVDVFEIRPGRTATTVSAIAGASNTSLNIIEELDSVLLDPATAPAERTTFSLPLNVLAAAIARVQHAAADPKRNASLAHTMIQFIITEQGNLITCALDGGRLATVRVGIPDWEGTPVNLLFPQTKALERLLTIAPTATAHVMVANEKILIAAKTDGVATEVVLNTAAVAYPNWQELLKGQGIGKPAIIAGVNLKALRDLFNRAHTICPSLKIGIRIKGKQLAIAAQAEAIKHVDAITLDDVKGLDEGADFTMFTSPGSIRDALDAIGAWTDAETVKLGFTEPLKPLIIAVPGYEYSTYIWPMHKES